MQSKVFKNKWVKSSRKGKIYRSYPLGAIYPNREKIAVKKPPVRYWNCVLIFRHIYEYNRPEREYRDHDKIKLNTVGLPTMTGQPILFKNRNETPCRGFQRCLQMRNFIPPPGLCRC